MDMFVNFSGPVFVSSAGSNCTTNSAFQGWTGMYTLVVSSLSPKFILKIATRIFQFIQYLRTKLDMLIEIAKSVINKVVVILGKQLFYPKILDFIQKHYSVATFAHINL